jgi:hypothetical protein
MKINIITEAAKLSAAIETLAKSKIDVQIQRLLVSAFWHRMRYGDNTFISGVLNAMPKGSRVSAAKKYCEAFMSVEFVKEKGLFSATNTKKYRDTVDDAALEAAAAVMWWEFKEKSSTEYSHEATVNALRKAFDKALKAATAAGDEALVEQLVNMDLPA